ncbi:MAG TPA: PRC-barrel domain-containing protein [Parvibaculum sp.]|jgi:sporulation protein YlmC with PRC-barrel domain
MKRLLTGTALLAICVPVMAYAAGAENTAPASPTMSSPMTPTTGTSRLQAAPEGADAAMSPDAVTQSNGVAVMSTNALSAYYLKGADVMGSDNKKLGTIDDIVLDESGQAKRALIAAGGVAGIGAKEVGVDFSRLTFAGQGVKAPVAQIDATADSLKSQPPVEKDKIGSGLVLASSVVGSKVKLQESKDMAKISDVILDKKGAAKYAAIDFGGVMGVGDKRVAVSYDKLGKAAKGQPIPLQQTKAELTASPAFVYEADDSTASIVPSGSNSTAPR